MRSRSQPPRGRAATRPLPRMHLPRTLAITAAGAIVVAAALALSWRPLDGVVLALLTAPTLLAIVSLAILEAAVRGVGDLRLRWITGGMVVATSMMLLQMLASSYMSADGGPLGTSGVAQAALNPLFHGALALGALLGAVRAPAALVAPAVAVGCLVGVLVAMDSVPLPALLEGSGFTTGFRASVATVAVLSAIAVVAWSRSIGRTPSGLHAWVAAALLLSALDQAALALAPGFLSSAWWASILLRVITYAVLAAGCLAWLTQMLVAGERWTDTELAAREEKLRAADELNRRLLHVADRLSGTLLRPHVCRSAVELARDGLRARAACVLPVAQAEQLRCVVGAQPSDADWAAAQLDSLLRDGHLRGPAVSSPASVAGERDAPEDAPPWAYVMAPVRSDDILLGHLVVLDSPDRRWSDQDLAYLVALVDQCSLALSRSRAHENVVNASSTLLASLRPERHDALAGVRLHSAYRAVVPGHDVGGDWFDSVEVDEHRAVLVVGDVMGKGWRAAAVMGQMRTALRAAATLGLDPAAALETLDRRVVDLATDEIVTVLYVVVDRARDRLGIARAGHPPPLVVGSDGHAAYVDEGGSPPIGVGVASRQEAWLPLADVATLVLYTDGLVERRSTGVDDGMGRLLDQVSRVVAETRAVDDDVPWSIWLETVRARTDWQDDVAVMVACFEGRHDEAAAVVHDLAADARVPRTLLDH